ncbi:MerR family transcriptional regulator [Streptomyces sp. NPDC004838]
MKPAPTLYTTDEAAERATEWRRLLSAGAAAITPATIRSWTHRGHLTRHSRDPHGRPLYDHDDLAHAEHTTRARALRLVGIGQQNP